MTVLELNNKMDAFRKFINKDVVFLYGGNGEIELRISRHIILKLKHINWLVTEFKLNDLSVQTYSDGNEYTITFKITE